MKLCMSDKDNAADFLFRSCRFLDANVTGQLFMCVTAHALCVCLSVCVWLWQGSFQTPQSLMNGSLCVRECVFVWSAVTFGHLLSSSMQSILRFKMPIRSSADAHKHVPCWKLHHLKYQNQFPRELWFTAACCCTCQTSLLLSCHRSFRTQSIVERPAPAGDSHSPASGDLFGLQTRDHD